MLLGVITHNQNGKKGSSWNGLSRLQTPQTAFMTPDEGKNVGLDFVKDENELACKLATLYQVAQVSILVHAFGPRFRSPASARQRSVTALAMAKQNIAIKYGIRTQVITADRPTYKLYVTLNSRVRKRSRYRVEFITPDYFLKIIFWGGRRG